VGTRREKTIGALASIAWLVSGAIGGVFFAVKVYGSELATLRTAQRMHCERVRLEKQAMYDVAGALNEWIKATHATSANVCKVTPGCTTVTVSRDVRIPEFRDEKCVGE
jgi:hypothetical protein